MMPTRKVKSRVLVWCAMVALLCGISIAENAAQLHRPTVRDSGQTSSIYMLAGEFRVVFANLLWIKAEKYHHEYLLKHRNWSENKELMALLDIITALDPHFVEAYEVGAYILANGYNDPVRATTYLDRAIAYNPDSWELHNIAAIMFARLGKFEPALKHARSAYELCTDPFYRTRNLRLIRTIRRLAIESQTGDKNLTQRSATHSNL